MADKLSDHEIFLAACAAFAEADDAFNRGDMETHRLAVQAHGMWGAAYRKAMSGIPDDADDD